MPDAALRDTLDPVFQRQVLALVVQDPAFLERYHDLLLPSYFDTWECSALVEIARSHYEKYRRIPSYDDLVVRVSVECERLDMDDARADRLFSALTDADAYEIRSPEYIVEHLVDFGRRRATLNALAEAAEIVGRPDSDLSRVGELVADAMVVGAERDLGQDLLDAARRIDTVVTDSDLYDPERKIPLGLPSMQRATRGGLARTEVAVVAAAPNVGKTTFGVFQGGQAALAGYRVLHVSLEPKYAELQLGYCCTLSQMSMEEIIGDYERYLSRMAGLGLVRGLVTIKRFAPRSIDALGLRTYMQYLRKRAGFEIDHLIVDYPDRMRLPRGKERHEGLDELYNQFSEIGEDFRCSILLMSHMNREAMSDPNANAGKVSGAWMKFADSDKFWVMLQTKEDKQANQVRISEEKVRRGTSGNITSVNVDYARSWFWETGAEPEFIGGTDAK